MKTTLAACAFAFACLADGAARAPRAEAPRPFDGENTFTLSQVQNERFRGRDVAVDSMKSHLQHAEALPPHLSQAVELNPDLKAKYLALAQQKGGGIGTAPALPPPFYDVEYVVPISIGTPSQTLYVSLDTASSDLWVFSTDTYKSEVSGHKLYDAAGSSTSTRLGDQSWAITYGDGASAAGIVYTDRVQIGATSVRSQAVEVAVVVSPQIVADTLSSGILGMSASGVANTVRPLPQRTYLENVANSLSQPLFTANLKKGRAGNYNFGYIESSEYVGSVAYAGIDGSSPAWKITVSGYQIGSKAYVASLWNGIVDTGTSLLLVPESILDSYYAQVSGAGIDPLTGMMSFPCVSKLPDFRFGIGSYRGLVPGPYLNYGPLNSTHCYGGMQLSRIGFAVLGDVLLKAQFVVFDFGQRRVGFANKNLQ